MYNSQSNNQDNQTSDPVKDFKLKEQTGSSKFRWVLLVGLLIILSYHLGFSTGKKGFVFDPKNFKIINQNNSPKEVDYQLLWDALKVVKEKYIENSPNPETVLYGAVKGAVESFGDSYTTFFPPSHLETFRSDLAGSFDGIGAEIGKRDGNLVIIAPLDDMPARKAGLLAGDIILQVNGETTSDWTVEQAVFKIRGPKGTEVVLNVFREGKTAPFDVKIKRDKIEIKSVKWEIRELDKDGVKRNIGIIRISRFGEDTKPLFEKAVNELMLKNLLGIVLDVRNNPGGFLQTAVDLASYWVEPGKLVVREEHSQGNPINFNAAGRNRLARIPTVVVMNNGSASASEILAGALSDYSIAKLIGEKSFGKGSVQELVDLRAGTAVKVTVARWITPGGKNLNKEGLSPDIEVKMTEADYKENRDPQIEKAIEEIIN